MEAKTKEQKQSGQTFIEFVLFMTIVAGFSFGTLAVVNGKIADLWKAMVVEIVDDPSQTHDLEFF